MAIGTTAPSRIGLRFAGHALACLGGSFGAVVLSACAPALTVTRLDTNLGDSIIDKKISHSGGLGPERMGRWIENDLRAANLLANSGTLRAYLDESGGNCVERKGRVECLFERFDVQRVQVYGDQPSTGRADWTVKIAWNGNDEPVQPVIDVKRSIRAVAE